MPGSRQRVVLVAALLAFLASLIATVRCVQFHRVFSTGMEPALPRGGIAASCSCGTRTTRDSIVVFRLPVAGGHEFVKRVIALGGDRIETRDEGLYVNGQLVSSPARDAWASGRAGPPLDPGAPAGAALLVAPGFVFLLGDEEESSQDSRTFGPIPEASIIGRVVLVFGRQPAGGFYVRRVP